MKILTTFFAACLFLFVAGESNAVTNLGAPSCGKWTEDLAYPPYRLYRQIWLEGFLSGAAAGTGEDVLKVSDRQSITLWMDNYCRANPLNSVHEGGVALFVELRKQIGTK
jgi:hypothetical protein